MQKAAIVVLPIVILAVVVYALILRREAQPSRNAGPSAKNAAPDSAAASETARLRAQVETLRKEEENQRQRAEAAEARLAEAAASASTTARGSDPKKSAAKRADWKTRRDAELEAKIKEIDWRKRIKGLVDYWKEMEKSRAEGRPPRMTPEMTEQLMKLTAEAVDFAKFLGLDTKDPYKSFQNEMLGAAWMDAFLQEVSGGTLSEDQLGLLRGTDLYKDDGSADDPEANQLDTWRKLIEHNRAFGTQTAGILSQDQHAQLSSAVTPNFMLSVYAEYMETPVTGGAQAVANYWLKSLEIPSDQRAAVEAVAAEFVRRQAEIAQAVSAQHGGLKTRDAEFDLLLRTIEAQAAAEKKLAETLQLDATVLKKIQRSSGAVIRLAN